LGFLLTTLPQAASAQSSSCSTFAFVVSNNTYYPISSADLQTALDCAPLGSTIVLQPLHRTPVHFSFRTRRAETAGSR
jgi:hypothetical protein